MILTEAQTEEIARRVAAILRASSKNVGEVPEVTTLAGITTLPALRYNGGIPEVVRAPISVLGQGADEAAAKANAAAEKAETAAVTVNGMVITFNDLIVIINAAISSLDTWVGKVEEATGNANTATAGTNSARQDTETATANAIKVTADANAALIAIVNAIALAISAAESANKAAALAIANTNPLVIPSDISIIYPKKITLGNKRAHIEATVLPEYVLQNIMFQALDRIIDVDMVTGKISPLSVGTARINVIPVQRTQISATIAIDVVAPSMRRLSGNRIRKTNKGYIRTT